MGGRRITGLKARVARECCISRGAKWVKSHSGGIKLEKFDQKVTVLVGVGSPKAGTRQGEQLQE